MKKGFKAVWVDAKGKLWSVLAGSNNQSPIGWQKIRYFKTGAAVAAPPWPEARLPFLFAFLSVAQAEAYLAKLFAGQKIQGHLEIWECEYEPYNPRSAMRVLQKSRIEETTPPGTVFAETIALTKLVGRVH